jgi:hypothetical protein
VRLTIEPIGRRMRETPHVGGSTERCKQRQATVVYPQLCLPGYSLGYHRLNSRPLPEPYRNKSTGTPLRDSLKVTRLGPKRAQNAALHSPPKPGPSPQYPSLRPTALLQCSRRQTKLSASRLTQTSGQSDITIPIFGRSRMTKSSSCWRVRSNT